jgi:hypothetical protein
MIQPKNLRFITSGTLPISEAVVEMPIQQSSDTFRRPSYGSYNRYQDRMKAGDPDTVLFTRIVEAHGFKVRTGGSPRRRRIQPLVLERLQAVLHVDPSETWIGQGWASPLRHALAIILEIEKRNGSVPVSMEYVVGLTMMIHRYGGHPDYSPKTLARRISERTPRWYSLQARENYGHLRREYGAFLAMLERYNVAAEDLTSRDLRQEPLPKWGEEIVSGMLERMDDEGGGSLTIDLEEPMILGFPIGSPEAERIQSVATEEGYLAEAEIIPLSEMWTIQGMRRDDEPRIPHEDRDYLQELLQRLTTYAMELEDELRHCGAYGDWIAECQAANGLKTTTRTFFEIPEE